MIFLGIHADGQALKIAKARKQKQIITIELLRTLPQYEEDSIVKPLYTLEPTIGKEFKVVTGLESCEVFIRTLQLKLFDKRKVLAALPFQLEGLVPFPLSEAFIIPQISRQKQDTSSRVQIFAVKDKQIENHLEKMNSFELDPDIVSSSPNALARYFSYFYSTRPDAIMFYFGAEGSTALCFAANKMEASYPFSFGIEKLIQSLWQDFPDLTRSDLLEMAYSLELNEVSPSSSPHFFETLFQLQREIDRILSFFQTKPYGKTQKIIIAGSFSSFSKFRDFFKSSLPESFELIASPAFGPYDESTIESFAIPIGLALDGGIGDERSLQLRQKMFISERAFRKKASSLLTYFGACAALALSLFISCHFYMVKKEKFLTSLCESYFPDSSSAGDLGDRIAVIEKKLAKQKKSSVLLLQMPSVSEVLAWLSTHPTLTRGTDSLINLDLIDIKHIRYQIIKHPKINAPGVAAVIKVDLEFNSPSSRIARDFHDALLKGDLIVDEKKEITWHVKDTVYQTSFFLKPKEDVK